MLAGLLAAGSRFCHHRIISLTNIFLAEDYLPFSPTQQARKIFFLFLRFFTAVL
jgi:hypothetical protein